MNETVFDFVVDTAMAACLIGALLCIGAYVIVSVIHLVKGQRDDLD